MSHLRLCVIVCIKCSHCFRNSKMTLCLIFITWFMVYFGSLVETSNEKPVAFLSSSVAFVVALLFFSQWAHSGSVCVCILAVYLIVFDKLNSTAQTAIPLKLNVKRHDTHSTAEMEWKNEPSNEEKTIGTKPRPITNLLCIVLIEFRVILRARSQFLTTVQYRNRQPKNVITYSNSHKTHDNIVTWFVFVSSSSISKTDRHLQKDYFDRIVCSLHFEADFNGFCHCQKNNRTVFVSKDQKQNEGEGKNHNNNSKEEELNAHEK